MFHHLGFELSAAKLRSRTCRSS